MGRISNGKDHDFFSLWALFAGIFSSSAVFRNSCTTANVGTRPRH
ncbi:MAG TPA: hypothetical protein VHS96_04800 [Bacteroidia bacterium]|nr:hypothetical protein [Bacteroidia bacterium]